MKNSNDIIGNRTRDLPASSLQSVLNITYSSDAMGVLSNDICRRTTPWSLPILIAYICHLGSTDVDITKADVFPEKVERGGRLGNLHRRRGTVKK